MRKPIQSFFATKHRLEVVHPINGESYTFKVEVFFYQPVKSKYMDCSLSVVVERAHMAVPMQTYHIEPMNNFSLLALVEIYTSMLFEWLTKSDIPTMIAQADRALREQHGPVIRVSGKEVKSLDLQIVEVEE